MVLQKQTHMYIGLAATATYGEHLKMIGNVLYRSGLAASAILILLLLKYVFTTIKKSWNVSSHDSPS